MISDEGPKLLEEYAEGDGICRCSCHDEDNASMHITACCHVCPACGQRIEVFYYERHVARCEGSR